MNQNFIRSFFVWSSIALITSCASTSDTNVWDYYIKNDVEKHVEGVTTSSKSKMLFRNMESVNKAQFELLAYSQDTTKYLVIGSHKVAKAFFIHDSLYHFDVNNLYSSVRGNDFIRQLGDLSIYFTHVPAYRCNEFLDNWNDVKTKFNAAVPTSGETIYIDYALTNNVYISFPKSKPSQNQDNCVIWVGKRKHNVQTENLIKALNDLKSFQ